MKKSTIIALVIVGLLVLFGISGYNGLISKDETVTAQWANVETVYQRRMDLIPNLVATVKGYAEHEKEVLTSVTEARAKATQVNVQLDNPQSIQQFQQAQTNLNSSLSRLLVSMERYPDLKANQQFRDLMVQLEGTENRISVERRKYNEVVKEYNMAIRKFPTVLYAGIFGFDKKFPFEAQQGADVAPKVEF